MRFTSTAGLVAFVASTVVDANISPLDLDGSVWEGLSSLNQRRAFTPQLRNRPVKRQSGWSPPSDLATPLKEVWDHCLKTYSDGNLFGFKNYGMDQLMAAEGSLNMCVRWESSEPVTAAQRTQVAAAINAQYQKWFKWLYGFDNFPFTDIPVKVVGWAVKDASLLQGDTSDIDVYTDKDGEGIPECAPACGRFFHQNKDYSGCKGGAARHYDQSVWLTDGLGGGTGGDWGQRIGREYFMNALNSENIHILLHEMGHTFGLDDFYDWTPTGVSSFVMLAGSAAQITDFDGWMVRNWWYELSRNRNWQSGASTGGNTGGNTGGSTGASTGGGSVSTPTTPTQTQPAPVSSSPPQSTAAASSQPPKVPTTAVRPTRVTKSISPVRTTSAGGNPVINVPSQTSAASSNSGGNGATAARWQQCGGSGWTGPSQCASGFTCTKHNDWYSQCL